MEKIKFDMSTGDAYEVRAEVQVGTEMIHVRKHIPLVEKMQMASELVQMTVAPDEELGIVNTSSLEDVSELYLIMKYYTDVDLTGVTVQQVYDWLVGYDAVNDIRSIIGADFDYVDGMAWIMRENIIAEYKERNGLAHALKTTFGFLLNGRDITETLAESREVSDQILDVVGRLNEAAKKDEAGKVKVAGNVINIGKKNK